MVRVFGPNHSHSHSHSTDVMVRCVQSHREDCGSLCAKKIDECKAEPNLTPARKPSCHDVGIICVQSEIRTNMRKTRKGHSESADLRQS